MIKINKTKTAAVLCALIMGASAIAPSFGFAVGTETQSSQSTETEAGKKSDGSDSSAEKEQPKTDSQGHPILGSGETGILIESSTGQVLFESDSSKRMYPASTTKVMTALIAVEAVAAGEVSMDEQIEITPQMLEGLDPDGSNMALKEGEIISFENLLKGLMIPSGNDAALAIAYRLSQSPDAFAQRMNDRAQQLGLNDTHFANPHGLHDENHYTTAADMAKIAREAMKHDTFRNIVDIAHVKIPPTNKTEKERYYINTNGLLSTMRYRDYYYKNSIGIKTGRTKEAGNCLVSAAKRNGMELIGVLFGGKDVSDSHKDSIRMLDYGFNNFGSIRAVSKDKILGEIKVKRGRSKDSVTLSAAAETYVVVPKDVSADQLEFRLNTPDALYAPLKKGQTVSDASIIYQGQEIGTVQLCVDADIERSIFWPVMAAGEALWSVALIRWAVYILLAAFIIFAAFTVYSFSQELKRAKRRRRRR